MLTLTTAFLMALTACSPDSAKVAQPAPSNPDIKLEFLSAPVEQSGKVSHDFGDIEKGATVAAVALKFVKPASDTARGDVTMISPDGAFVATFTTSSCVRELKKASDVCSVILRFMKKDVIGSYEGLLKIGVDGAQLDFPVYANVVGPQAPENSITAQTPEGVEITSGFFDYGPANAKGQVDKTLRFVNNTSSSVSFPVTLGASVNFIKSTDTCNGKAVKAGAVCSIRIIFKADSVSPETDILHSTNLTYGPLSLELRGTTRGVPVVVLNPDLKFYEGVVVTEVTSVNWGSVEQRDTLATQNLKQITIKNIGQGPSTPINPVIAGSSKYTLQYDGCKTIILGAGKSCYVRVGLIPGVGQTADEIVDGTLTISGNTVLSLSATVLGVTPVYSDIKVLDGTNIITSFDFGSKEGETSVPDKILTVKNVGDGPATVKPVIELTGDSSFVLVTNGCTAALGVGKTCSIKIRFVPGVALETDVLKTANLMVDTLSIELKGTVIGAPPKVADLKVLDGTAQVSILDLGSVAGSALVYKVVTIKNMGTGASTAAPVISTTGTGFSVGQNYCTGSLAPNATCTFRVNYQAGEALETDEVKTGSLSVVSNTTSSTELKATVLGEPLKFSELKIFDGSSEITNILNLGEVQGNSSLFKVFTIKNVGDGSTLAPPTVSLFGEGFTLGSNFCTQVLAPNASCSLRINYSAPTSTTENQFIQGQLTMGENVVLLSAIVPAAIPDLRILDDSTETTIVSFGTVPSNSAVAKVLTVKNVGNGTTAATPNVSLTGANFSILNNYCSAPLAPNATCQIRINFASGSPTVDEDLTGELAVDSTIVLLTAIAQAPGIPEIVFYENSVEVSALDFGDFAPNKSLQKTIMVVNEGQGPAAIPSVSLADGYTLSSNNCPASLAVNANCQLRITFNSGILAAGDYIRSLSILGSSLDMFAVVYSALNFEPAILPDLDSMSSTSLVATGGKGPYTYSVESTIGSWYGDGQLIVGNNTSSNLIIDTIKATDSLGQEKIMTFRVKKSIVPNNILSLSSTEGMGSFEVKIDEGQFESQSSGTNLEVVPGSIVTIRFNSIENSEYSFGGSCSGVIFGNDCVLVMDSNKTVDVVVSCFAYHHLQGGTCLENLTASINSISPAPIEFVALDANIPAKGTFNPLYSSYNELASVTQNIMTRTGAGGSYILSFGNEVLNTAQNVARNNYMNNAPYTVNLQASTSVTSCSPSIPSTIGNCSAASFTVLPQPLTGSGNLDVLLNSQTTIGVPYKTYTLRQVVNINEPTMSDLGAYSFNGIEFNDKFYFVASDNGRDKLFVMNENEQIQKVMDNNPSGADIVVPYFTIYNEELYFSANNSSGQLKIHKIKADGSVVQVSNINPSGSDFVGFFAVYNSKLYFGGASSGGFFANSKIYSLDSNGVISQITNFNPNNPDGIQQLVKAGEFLYFVAMTNTDAFNSITKLHKIDSMGNISLVSNINNGATDGISQAFEFNNKLYFSAKNNSGYTKLFKVDSNDVISQVSNLNPSGNDGNGFWALGKINGEMYLRAGNGSYTDLFKLKSDDSLTRVSIGLGQSSFGLTMGAVLNGELYVSGTNGLGTTLLKINPHSGKITKMAGTSYPLGYEMVIRIFKFKNSILMSQSNLQGNYKLFSLKQNLE